MAYFEDNLPFVQKKQTTIRKLYTYIKMKNFNLHTICQLQTQRNEWTGVSVFSIISNPATFNYGKVDYNKLEDTDVG